MASSRFFSSGEVLASHEKLRRQFSTFYQYREILRESYGRVLSICTQGNEEFITNFKEETSDITKVLDKDPIMLIGGQVNCGKSSFVNLLLNRRIVPVDANPCTARIVRIKYSPEEYFQLTDCDGNERGPRCPLDKKSLTCLKKHIKLEEGRENTAAVAEMVEIGLDSPLLKSGLQIIDTPGLSENEALDKVVHQCLDGVLQVLFYVIDGNTSWRMQDGDFIARIMMESPDLKIIYICNKCEEKEDAKEQDDSDDDPDDTESPPTPKGHLAYSKLRNACLLTGEEDISCNRYFQISCSRLKRLRSRNYVPDEFSAEYRRLINSLCSILRHFLYHSLQQAILKLFIFVSGSYDVCRPHECCHLEEQSLVLVPKMKECQDDVAAAVLKYQDQLDDAVSAVIAKGTGEAVDEIMSLLVCIVDVVGQNSKTFYSTLVGLATLMEKIKADEAVQSALKAMRQDVEIITSQLLKSCEAVGASGNVLTAVTVFIDEMRKSGILDIEGCSDALKMAVVKLLVDTLKEDGDGEEFAERGYIDKILQSVNPKHVSSEIFQNISRNLSARFDALRLTYRLVLKIDELLEASTLSREIRRSFPTECLILNSMLSSIQHKEITDLEIQVGRSRHCIVYKGRRGLMTLAARRTIADDHSSKDFGEMARTFATVSDLSNKDHLNILKPIGAGRDSTGQIFILLPYIERTLFQGLYDGELEQCSLEERLSVGLQIVSGCLFLKKMGLEAVDLRPNNIRLQDGCPKIDISKWRRLDAPYPPPDGEAPFHFPPECIRHEQKRFPSTQDSYSCTVLIWMLACGKFIRPPFARYEGPDGQVDPRIAILLNIGQVRSELYDTIRRIGRDQDGFDSFLPLMKKVLEKCITDETERLDIKELHELLQSQLFVNFASV